MGRDRSRAVSESSGSGPESDLWTSMSRGAEGTLVTIRVTSLDCSLFTTAAAAGCQQRRGTNLKKVALTQKLL